MERKISEALIMALFEGVVPKDQREGVGAAAYDQISRHLRIKGLFDPSNALIVLSLTAEQVATSLAEKGLESLRDFPTYFLVACRYRTIAFVKEELSLESDPLEDLEASREGRGHPGLYELPLASLCDEARLLRICSKAIAGLSERDQKILKLVLTGRQSDRELAEAMRMDLDNFRVAVCRAFRRLRVAVQRGLDDDVLIVVERPPSAPTPKRGTA